MTRPTPESAFGAPPQGGDPGGPAVPDPRRLLDRAHLSTGEPMLLARLLSPAAAAQWLAAQGVKQVINLEGGIDRWSRQVDAGVSRY